MTPADRLESASEARAIIGTVISLLENPTVEALDRSGVELQTATARIEEINKDGLASGAPLRSAVTALRKDLQRAALLLRHAWEFRAAAGGQAAYTPRGELTAPLAPISRLELRG